MSARIGRPLRIAGLLLVYLGRSLLGSLAGRRARAAAPQRLRRLFEDLGGTFVKFGQMLALQPNVLAADYCNALYDLLDRVAPFPYAEVQRTVAEELGRPLAEVFDAFEPIPLATASVGQVHVAYLGGQKVAVKVQRPRVEAEFAGDLRLMTAAMAAIRRLHLRPLYWLLEPMSEFVGWTWEEIDYRHEARYSERLRLLAADNPVQCVPKVYLEYSTRRVLVVEFLDGVTLLDLLRAREQGDEIMERRLAAAGFDGRRFAANVIDNFIGDAFRHGLYHADLHPANLMILPGNVVGYIDFGITGVLSPYSRRHLMVMTLALAQGDMETLAGEFLRLSVHADGADLAGFQQGLAVLSADWYEVDGGHRRLRVNFTRVMTDMLQLSRRTGVMPERDIVKYIRSAIAIDGLNLRFEPEFHVGRHLEEQCRRFLRLQAVRDSVSEDTVLAWADLGTRLVAEAPERMGGLLDRLARGKLVLQAHQSGGGARQGERSRAVHLAAMVLTLAGLMTFARQPPSLGWNLFTAELFLTLLALAHLLPVLARLASPILEGDPR
jgi:ubiquinone biosynthesis protein